MQNNRKAGFTLVELLVVIAIIALLMGIILPALNIARQRAQTIVCGANLKNYGYALHMYADTNNDKCPFSFTWLYSAATLAKTTGHDGCPEDCRWHYDKDTPDGTLWPYLRNIKAHICPTFKALAKNGRCMNADHRATLPYKPTYCYSMNRWLGLYCPPLYYADEAEQAILLTPEPSLRLSQVKRSTQCFAFSEENFWIIPDPANGVPPRPGDGDKAYSMTAIGKNDLWLYANKNWKEGACGNLATFHNVSAGNKNGGKANVVYVDGHVSLTMGLAGYNAYWEYGRPYNGHENMNGGQFW